MQVLEATSDIRDKEKVTKRHQIVIAITAHTMKGDREQGLARCMDDYLCKPIRPQKPDDILDKYLAFRTKFLIAVEPIGISR